jgi:hypothetical protein
LSQYETTEKIANARALEYDFSIIIPIPVITIKISKPQKKIEPINNEHALFLSLIDSVVTRM